MEYKTNLGYVKRGCGTLMRHTQFSPVGKPGATAFTIFIIMIIGFVFQIVFVWIVTAVLLKMTFKDYDSVLRAFTHEYVNCLEPPERISLGSRRPPSATKLYSRRFLCRRRYRWTTTESEVRHFRRRITAFTLKTGLAKTVSNPPPEVV